MKHDWGEETKMKLNFAERLASGRKGFSYKCKMVGVLMGNISKCEDEMNYFIEKNLPVILIDDSDMTKSIRGLRKGENIRGVSESKIIFIIKIELRTYADYKKLIDIEDDSENLASLIHLCLTLTI